MTVEQALEQEIQISELWISIDNDETSTYRRDLKKRIELINWVLNNIKNKDITDL